MSTEILLIDSLLCFLFAFLNIISKRKRFALLPSTLFALSWGVSSLGCYLYTTSIFEDSISISLYYKNSTALTEIGYYQFYILLTIFIAFICARKKSGTYNVYRNDFTILSCEIGSTSSMLKYALYLYFIIGLIRLSIVLTAVGFNYSAMRDLHITSRSSFSSFDVQLIRVGSYLMQISVLYIGLAGMKSAIDGISIRRTLILLLLFCPFQMSFGGRLFVLSFFLPFVLSYYIVFAMNGMKYIHSSDKHKLRFIIFASVFLVIVLQILKQGEVISLDSLADFSTQIFYNSSSYIYMGEFWNYVPDNYDLQFGRNLITGTCPLISQMMNFWIDTHNSASVCIPSMIPGMYLDFGFWGSLPVYFIIFYNVEKIAINKISHITFNNMLIYLMLCIFCFNTAGSSLFDCLKSLFINMILIYIIKKSVKTRCP